MGISWIPQIRAESPHNMKFFIISALVAAVSAEAQYLGAAYPYAGYTGLAGAFPYPAGLGYAAAVPFGSSSGLDPLTQGLDAATQGVLAPYGHFYGKRAAEPEAEPQYLTYAGLGGYAGLPYSIYAGYPYTGLGYSAYHHPAAYGVSACRNYVG